MMLLPKSRKAGCYLIRNTISGRVYVGSTSKSLRRRAYNHRIELRQGIHPNIHLQRSWRKYGENAFEFVVLEECEPERCFELEQWWMDLHDAYRNGYNRCPNAGSWAGRKHSEESKRKCGLANVGRPMSQKNRSAMSARLRIIAAAIAAAHTGKKHSEERRKANSFGRHYGIWRRNMAPFMSLPA